MHELSGNLALFFWPCRFFKGRQIVRCPPLTNTWILFKQLTNLQIWFGLKNIAPRHSCILAACNFILFHSVFFIYLGPAVGRIYFSSHMEFKFAIWHLTAHMNWRHYKSIISLSSEFKRRVRACIPVTPMPDINKPECQWSEVASCMNCSSHAVLQSGSQFPVYLPASLVGSQDSGTRIVAMWTKSPAVSWSLQSHACFLPDYGGVLSSGGIHAVQSGLIIWIT